MYRSLLIASSHAAGFTASRNVELDPDVLNALQIFARAHPPITPSGVVADSVDTSVVQSKTGDSGPEGSS